MLFNSFQFLIFFVVVTVLYYTISSKWRWLLLLLASCFFYMAFIPAYILVLFAIIITDYLAGRLIEKYRGKKRKTYLAISIAVNLGVLFVFKYYNFFIENISDLLLLVNLRTKPFPLWQLILPVGLSFHTFQAMSYTIEVYKGRQKAEKHFGIYALYVMFYPQLVAGPIERPQNLLHQFYEKRPVNYDEITAGLKLMLWGFFMKCVVADRLAIYVDYVYANATAHSRLALITAVFFYAFQIYCDFAGYSLIAIGAAGTMGIKLSANFRQPYFASSIRDLWTRWHITLSNWFRDYLYIPLGGNRKGMARRSVNILIVFIVFGFWHGANWTYIVFGLMQALLVMAESFRNRKAAAKANFTGYLYTFIIFSVCLVLIRSVNLHNAFSFIQRLFNVHTPWKFDGEFEERALLLYSLFGIACVILADIKREFFSGKRFLLNSNNMGVRLTTVVMLVVIILLLGVFDGSQFIYFQF